MGDNALYLHIAVVLYRLRPQILWHHAVWLHPPHQVHVISSHGAILHKHAVVVILSHALLAL